MKALANIALPSYVDLMKRTTIKDVAREAGVSISAVSRAFSNGSLAKEKRDSILEVADRLGYRPSLVARGLASQRSQTVTLVTGRMWDTFDALFLEQLAEGLADMGHKLVVAPASKQKQNSGGVYQALDDQSDAVIIAAGTMPIEATQALVRGGVPVILAGRFVDEEGIDCVSADNADGGRQVAELLLRTGCQRPCYFGFDAPSPADQERGDAFCSTSGAAGIPAEWVKVATRTDNDVFEAAAAMLGSPQSPDAVFCATDRLAFSVIEAAKALGIAVPDALSVVGFNNVPAAERRTYRLTTVNYPVSRVVGEVIGVLKARLDDPDLPPIRARIPVQLTVRDTTRRLFS